MAYTSEAEMNMVSDNHELKYYSVIRICRICKFEGRGDDYYAHTCNPQPTKREPKS